eukprot:g31890.t1
MLRSVGMFLSGEEEAEEEETEVVIHLPKAPKVTDGAVVGQLVSGALRKSYDAQEEDYLLGYAMRLLLVQGSFPMSLPELRETLQTHGCRTNPSPALCKSSFLYTFPGEGFLSFIHNCCSVGSFGWQPTTLIWPWNGVFPLKSSSWCRLPAPPADAGHEHANVLGNA